MNNKATTPHRSLLTVADHLNQAAQALGALAQSLAAGSPTNGHRTRQAISPKSATKPARKVKAAHNRVTKPKAAKTPRTGVPHNRIAHLLKTVKLPKEKRKPQINRLTKEQEDDVVLLLQSSNMTVNQIATLFNKTRAAIYGVRDRRNLKVHTGSKELMAGIARKKAETAKAVQPVVAPVAAEPVAAGT